MVWGNTRNFVGRQNCSQPLLTRMPKTPVQGMYPFSKELELDLLFAQKCFGTNWGMQVRGLVQPIFAPCTHLRERG